MEDLMQIDPEVYGNFGGPREYGEAMGRFGGGGWISDPMAATDADGKGIWAQPPARDGEKNLTNPGFADSGPYGADPIRDAVERSAGDPSEAGGWK